MGHTVRRKEHRKPGNGFGPRSATNWPCDCRGREEREKSVPLESSALRDPDRASPFVSGRQAPGRSSQLQPFHPVRHPPQPEDPPSRIRPQTSNIVVKEA